MNKRRRRVKLIFNPIAGATDKSPVQLMDVINEMQRWKLVPEPYLVEAGCDLLPVVHDALQSGIRLFAACGGDGTVESVAAALVGTQATLGIIPTGTRNNVALGLGIPEDISAAVALLRTGRRVKVDVGYATCHGAPGYERSSFFLETCSVGLVSALFPVVDDIQHGNLARIGDFLATFIAAPSAKIHLVMDRRRTLDTQAHVVLVANFPYVGPHYPIAAADSFQDGLLDVLVFADLSKLDLLGHLVQVTGGGPEDPRVQRYRAHQVVIETDPPLSVIADGVALGKGPISVRVQRRVLAVMASAPQVVFAKENQDHPSIADLLSTDVKIEL